MPRLQLHTPRNAPTRGARSALRDVLAQRGHVPKLHAALAQSEPTLRAYMLLGAQLINTSLTPLERQAVMLVVNRYNEAPYCMSGHSAQAQAMGMPEDWLRALREAEPLPDARLEALCSFTRALLAGRGAVDDAQWRDFIAHGYAEEQALEVMLAITLKTLSNFASRFGGLTPDLGHQAWAWAPASAAAPEGG